MQNESGLTVINGPCFPQYNTSEKRLQTFDYRWPDSVQQTSEFFAESGFFYTGFEDCVRCFHCGIALRNWEPSDNPNEEHAKWSGTCAFLISLKGQNYINYCLDNAIQMLNEEHHHHNIGYTTATRRSNIALSASVHEEASILNQSDVVHKANLMETEGAASNLIRGRHFWDNGIGKVLNPTESRNINELTNDTDHEEGLPDPGQPTGRPPVALPTMHAEYTRNREEPYMPVQNRNEQKEEKKNCQICAREMTVIVFIPCGHIYVGACAECGPLLRTCPECDKTIIAYREFIFYEP